MQSLVMQSYDIHISGEIQVSAKYAKMMMEKTGLDVIIVSSFSMQAVWKWTLQRPSQITLFAHKLLHGT